MRVSRSALCIFAFACGVASAQGVESDLSFEVASVKPSGPHSVRNSDGGPGSHDPERFAFTSAVLRDLLFRAYGVDFYREQIEGPAWIDTEKYDVAVKIPKGTTKEQFRQMLRNLLTERFKLEVHRDTRLLAVYELAVSKHGPKLKASIPNGAVRDLPAAQPAIGAEDKNGFPLLPPGRPTWVMSNRVGVSRLAAQQQRVSVLSQILTLPLGRPIIDKTGLTGLYDFTLEYDPRPATRTSATDSQEASAPDIFIAIQQQLGLKLVDAKDPLDVVVVDHALKVPTEN
jgi:uncharacterized protein (TIGR03435 family)